MGPRTGFASQYARFRDYRWQPITEPIEPPSIPRELRDHLDEIVDVFGSETAVSLELMTHREKPWVDARGGAADGCSVSRHNLEEGDEKIL
jgi:uncharacterized phage-associated protein